MSSRSLLGRTLSTALLVLVLQSPAFASVPDGSDKSVVRVMCSKASALIQISVESHRKIGDVVLEVRNDAGRTVYREEGRAMSTELVRKLDKGVFPKGAHTVTVTAKDFTISQELVIE
jgi:hypothetical protein